MNGAKIDLGWGALGLADVSEASLRTTFRSLGVAFDSCAHVTANESLAKVMRASGLRAISAVELTDVIVWDSMPRRQRIPVSDYPVVDVSTPPEDGVDPIAAQLSSWRSTITGNRIGFRLNVDNVLRTYLREDASDEGSAELLRRSVRDFRTTLEFLSASNFTADDFSANEPLLRVALDAWRHVETTVPEFANVRHDLWDHLGALSNPKGSSAKDLRRRLDEVLRHVFAWNGGRVQVLFHGFFFFTPQQWALFKLLRSHPSVDACFVVHDDGTDRSFETWRHYFVERWAMPRVRYVDVPSAAVRSSVLGDSLEGRTVDARPVARNTRIVRFANATEFVRHWNLQAGAVDKAELKPLLFAPAPDEIERIVGRMSSDESDLVVNLANLPVGQFLLAAHECVTYVGRAAPECTLDERRFVDMVASTFLDSVADGMHPSRFVPAMRRALPFFSSVRTTAEWRERAIALERLVVGEVAAFGARDVADSDVARMTRAVGNELRQVPWCDLTVEEVGMVRFAVDAAKAVVDEIASEGLRRTDNYVAWIRKRLERAMANLDPAGREEIERKLHGVGVGMSGVIDPEGIRDVVGMILGREIENGPGGDDLGKRVKDVRSLDAFAYRKATVDVHVANLAETIFPARAFPYGWPFSEGALKKSAHRNVSEEILSTRSATAQLGDLYLFRLALDGVGSSSELTLSWIGEAGGEFHNPSTLLNLVTEPKVRDTPVKVLAGGLGLSPGNHGAPLGGARTLPNPRAFDVAGAAPATRAAVTAIPIVARGSAKICPRRFAIQWALGPSGSFQAPHQQKMLFGNVLGAMSLRRRFHDLGASESRRARTRLVADLWRHLTPGERASSLSKRRVLDVIQGSTYWQWIFTIGGRKNGDQPTDLAYRVAFNDRDVAVIPADVVGAGSDVVLPPRPPHVTAKNCAMCPVSPRCAERLTDERRF